MKKKVIMLFLTLTALVLEILPYGAICNFANPEGEPFRLTYSYFSLTPFGYANFSPFIVAILTCVLMGILLISITVKKQIEKPILIISSVATVLSFAPLLYGIQFFSIVGAFISITLLSTTFLAFLKEK